MFGMPADDDGSRTDPMFAHTIITIPHYQPDFDALRAASTRIIPAAGIDSDGEMVNRGASAGAEAHSARRSVAGPPRHTSRASSMEEELPQLIHPQTASAAAPTLGAAVTRL